MFILVNAGGNLSLQDSDNFREFSIVDESDGLAVSVLSAIGEVAEDDHFWLDANAIVELSERDMDQQWKDSFWEMLAKVEAYGYSNMALQQVKAHRVSR